MKAVWILCGILLFLLVLGSVPLSVRFQLQKTLRMEVRIAGIRVFSFPQPVTTAVDLRKFTYRRHKKRLEKEAKKAARKQRKEARKEVSATSGGKKKPKIADAHKPETGGTLDRLREMLPMLQAVLDTVPRFFGRMECTITRLHVISGGEDAAQAAIHFGMLSQSAAYLLEILDRRTRLQPLADGALSIHVDFTAPQNIYDVDFTLTVRPCSVLHTGADFLAAWIRRQNKA